MNEIYVVCIKVTDEDEVVTRVLDNKFFTDRDEARKAMVKDFNLEKSDADDGIDDVETEVFSPDSMSLSVNMTEVVREWEVRRLTAEGYEDAE